MLYRPLGLSLSLAAGKRDTDFTDSQGNPMHPRLRYAKLGWQHRFFSVGNTAFSIDFAQNKSLALAGDVARALRFQAVQHFDRIGTDLFFGLSRRAPGTGKECPSAVARVMSVASEVLDMRLLALVLRAHLVVSVSRPPCGVRVHGTH